ncbi:MAG: hypothetical protein ABI467_00045 [Kofleriaceae bacterium]
MPPPLVAVTEVEVEPLAVALLDDHTVAAIPAVTDAAHAGAARVGAHHMSTGVTSGATTGAATRTEPTTRPQRRPQSALMTMRQPEPKGMSDDFMARFLANSKPLQPKAIEGERIEDDIVASAANLGNPRWIANHSPDQVTAERMRYVSAMDARDDHELQHDGAGYEADHATFTGKVDPDGTAHLVEKRRYDPTEILMKKFGNDPYAANKLRMLDGTRDERFEIGKTYQARQLAQSAVIAQQDLTYLWARTTGVAERKQALFEMWDECAETGSDELVAGGAAARRMIVGFIKDRMTGGAAYTVAELAAFNANKKSSAAFAPYAD